MINLPNLSIWAACWSGDPWILDRTIRVLHYCQRIMNVMDCFLFSCVDIYTDGIRTIRIPKLDWDQWSALVNTTVPRQLLSKSDCRFTMCVHEDGFPIDLKMWDPAFLEYDYLGAPWDPKQCGGWPKESGWGDELLVGNGGFFLQSRKMMETILELPIDPAMFKIPSDVYVCRTKRKFFEDRGIRFAAPDVAARFSTEQTHKGCASFGFHGRRDSITKYQIGWKLIENSEL